ncbi:magnesium transporter [PVC group bacterium (ex Bugula neritina AB1)]|nr:magnesium transporter [PVC group bacterium (ex Bugula neritina AB1)]
MKKYSLIAPELREILSSKDYRQKLCVEFDDLHAHEVSMALEGLDPHEIAQVIFAFSVFRRVEIFEHFDDEDKNKIFMSLDISRQVEIISYMSHDERIDLIKTLPEELQNLILKKLDISDKEDIDQLLSYGEGSVGALVTSAYASIAESDTVKEALEHICKDSEEKETIYYIYVVDKGKRLLGLVSLRQLILARSTGYIRDIMKTDIVKVSVDDDQSQAAKIIRDYDFLAIPAVNAQGLLVGIVTVDDVVDVVVAEDTEKMLNLAAAGKYVPYISSSSFYAARQRLFWLIILIGVGFISGHVLERYQEVLENIISLIFFIPMLCASAGNAGTQSATVIIRELATDSIENKNIWFVWKKEFKIGLWLGAILGILGACRAALVEPFGERAIKTALTVGIAMLVVILISMSCGALFPLLCKRYKVDPALVSGPLVSSLVDVCCLFIYLELARFVFQL